MCGSPVDTALPIASTAPTSHATCATRRRFARSRSIGTAVPVLARDRTRPPDHSAEVSRTIGRGGLGHLAGVLSVIWSKGEGAAKSMIRPVTAKRPRVTGPAAVAVTAVLLRDALAAVWC